MSVPIAVIGMACRAPGAASTADLWQVMLDQRDPIARLGTDRWTGTVEGVERFDADFFGVTAAEADMMDPQQRMLLEVTHEAIEDAGCPAADLRGSTTGVFVAQHRSDYAFLQYEHGVADDLRAVLGTASGITSGRVSLAFDLRGPSLTVDTGCSSALVAVHLAVRSLRSGESSAAVVGGVNVVLLPTMHDAFVEAGMAAADGRCKFGDAAADGFVRSDAIAAVLLKPLDAALAAGDRIHAVIRGSAVNNDGGRGHLLEPSVDGQAALLRAAYVDAAVDPADVAYVEVHGSGTALGDRAELTALSRVVGTRRPAGAPCRVGSAKSTFGHAESAAGLLGMIRAALCLTNAAVPPNHHLHDPHRLLDPRAGLTMSRTAAALPRTAAPTVAGVTGFGSSGTNAHIVLESAPPPAAAPVARDAQPVLLVAAARTPRALDEQAGAYRDLAVALPTDRGEQASGAVTLDDLAAALATQRDHYDHRLAVVARTPEEAATRLADAMAGRLSPGVRRGRASDAARRTTFVFSGHGSQWAGMARELLATEPVFAATLAECDAAVRAVAGWSVLDQLTAGDPTGGFAVTQPLLWAVQVGLAAVWRSWGIEPDAVVGHSVGEVAAAHVAGALDLDQAAAVVVHRSRLAGGQCGGGTMLHVPVSGAEADVLAREAGGQVVVAAYNGPASSVLSGPRAELRAVADRLAATGVDIRWVEVDVAAHGPQMDEPARQLEHALRGLTPRPTTRALHLGGWPEAGAVPGPALDAAFWAGSLRRPVRFADAMRGGLDEVSGDVVRELARGPVRPVEHTGGSLAGPSLNVVVEISPHPVLLSAIRDIAAAQSLAVTAVGSLRRGGPERATMLERLAELFVAGVPVRAAGVAVAPTGRRVPLPTYPWQHRSYWLPAPAPGPRRLRPTADAGAEPLSGPWKADLHLAVDPEEESLEEVIAARIAATVGVPVAAVTQDRPLALVGMDSMQVTELCRGLRTDTGVTLPSRIVHADATLASLAGATRAELDRAARKAAPEVDLTKLCG